MQYEEVDCYQLQRFNIAEIIEWIESKGGNAVEGSFVNGQPYVEASPHKPHLRNLATIGDWIVYVDGGFLALCDAEFRRRYSMKTDSLDFDFERRFPECREVKEAFRDLSKLIREYKPNPAILQQYMYILLDAVDEVREEYKRKAQGEVCKS